MTPTDELCAKLGELGIKYTADDSNDYEVIEWRGSYDLWWQFVYDPYVEEPYGELRLLDTGSTNLTPKQAIAATVGVGTCEADDTDLMPFVRADSDDLGVGYIHVMECSVCGGTYEHVNGSYEFCPRCGRKVVSE